MRPPAVRRSTPDCHGARSVDEPPREEIAPHSLQNTICRVSSGFWQPVGGIVVLALLTLLPLWRMMMFPVLTTSPPYFFTPRYWGLESRPFLVEPVPFLCAASTLKEKRAGAEVD